MITESQSFWSAMVVGYGAIIVITLFAVRTTRGRNWFFDHSGLEFILGKFQRTEKEPLPTGVIWALGIYVALFGIASQRYENRVDLLEYKHTAFLTTVAAGAPFVGAKLEDLENSKCPVKPDIVDPLTVFRSMFCFQDLYPEFEGLLIRTVEEWKNNLSEADLSGVNLSGVNLSGANLSEANLSGANLSGANLSEANMRGAHLSEANLSGANLSEANMRGADLGWAHLFGANLNRVDLHGALLREADLGRAQLVNADLHGASLFNAYLRGAVLSGADLGKADLRRADLGWAHLWGADLSGADLSGADMSNSDMSEVNLSDADLDWVNLTGARNISFTQLSRINNLWKPRGIKEEILLRLRAEKPSLFQELVKME